MKNFIRQSIFIAQLFILSACTLSGVPLENAVKIRLESSQAELKRTARQLLYQQGFYIDDGDAALPLLVVDEDSGYDIESLAEDGSVRSYEITYTLTYRFKQQSPQTIALRQVIDYSENRYRASQVQIRQMINSLRNSALIQMLITLKTTS